MDKPRKPFLWAGSQELQGGNARLIGNGFVGQSSSASQIWSVSGERCDYVGYGGSGNTLTNLGATLKFRLTTLIKPCSRRLPKSQSTMATLRSSGRRTGLMVTLWCPCSQLCSVIAARRTEPLHKRWQGIHGSKT
jgi:hypothetical protein